MRRDVVLVLAVAAFTAACSSGTSTHPATGTTTSGAVAAPAIPAAATPTKAGPGAPQTLNYSGGTATITVLKVVDPAKPTQGTESAGLRDVAVQIRIVGNGPKVFTSGMMSTLHGLDADGQHLNIHAGWPTSAGPELDVVGGVSVASGDTESGFVTFEVPTGAKLTRVQYTPPGGAMVEWTVG